MFTAASLRLAQGVVATANLRSAHLETKVLSSPVDQLASLGLSEEPRTLVHRDCVANSFDPRCTEISLGSTPSQRMKLCPTRTV